MTACLFCQISQRQVPATIVYEDEYCLAFKDINPKAKVHLLVIPKKHIDHVMDLTLAESELMGHMLCHMKDIAATQPLTQQGFRLITNTGVGGGQEVYHLHFHLLAGF